MEAVQSFGQRTKSATQLNNIFITDIRHILDKDNIKLSANTVSQKTYELRIGGYNDVLRILHYMYDDSTPETRLNRKYKTVQQCYEYYK